MKEVCSAKTQIRLKLPPPSLFPFFLGFLVIHFLSVGNFFRSFFQSNLSFLLTLLFVTLSSLWFSFAFLFPVFLYIRSITFSLFLASFAPRSTFCLLFSIPRLDSRKPSQHKESISIISRSKPLLPRASYQLAHVKPSCHA